MGIESIWVAGASGMVGGALVRQLRSKGLEVFAPTRKELDLSERSQVIEWCKANRPAVAVVCAAKVGGILAHEMDPVGFLDANLLIQSNVLAACHHAMVSRVVFMGSSCIYPKYAEQPISEEQLLTGRLEPTNEGYAIAKIAGIRLVQAYREQYGHDWVSLMPTNLYGPGDNYDDRSSHVLAALLKKIHWAKIRKDSFITLWGDGSPLREFMHCDDLANAVIHILDAYHEPEHLNIGSGQEISVENLARLIMKVVGVELDLRFDKTKPNGTPRKLLDASRLNALGWRARLDLEQGISLTYQQLLDTEHPAFV